MFDQFSVFSWPAADSHQYTVAKRWEGFLKTKWHLLAESCINRQKKRMLPRIGQPLCIEVTFNTQETSLIDFHSAEVFFLPLNKKSFLRFSHVEVYILTTFLEFHPLLQASPLKWNVIWLMSRKIQHFWTFLLSESECGCNENLNITLFAAIVDFNNANFKGYICSCWCHWCCFINHTTTSNYRISCLKLTWSEFLKLLGWLNLC